ncbi:hypothetical protein TI04_00165 [Achromatium sp. WMS2]|nr:hypothetical protein TI04_00165 [Achromatium sp. WMS2]
MHILNDLNILIVEDNRAQARLIEIFLREMGVRNPIMVMKRSSDAWNFLFSEVQKRPDHLLIFLDLNMPGINGYDILQEIKKRTDTKAIPVIVITSSVNPDDRELCKKLGANAFIQKPPSLELIRDTVAQL